MSEHLNFQTEEDISNYLRDFGIPVELWGQGSTKTIGHLLKEINNGETILIQQGRELLRQVKFSAVRVAYRDSRDVYELVEDRQEFADGRVRRRDIGSSICEKIQPKETPKEAAERGLLEELKVHTKVRGGKEAEEIGESPSYPGLKTHYLRYDFNAELRQGQFSLAGYVHSQDDKTTYFVWKKKKLTKDGQKSCAHER